MDLSAENNFLISREQSIVANVAFVGYFNNTLGNLELSLLEHEFKKINSLSFEESHLRIALLRASNEQYEIALNNINKVVCTLQGFVNENNPTNLKNLNSAITQLNDIVDLLNNENPYIQGPKNKDPNFNEESFPNSRLKACSFESLCEIATEIYNDNKKLFKSLFNPKQVIFMGIPDLNIGPDGQISSEIAFFPASDFYQLRDNGPFWLIELSPAKSGGLKCMVVPNPEIQITNENMNYFHKVFDFDKSTFNLSNSLEWALITPSTATFNKTGKYDRDFKRASLIIIDR